MVAYIFTKALVIHDENPNLPETYLLFLYQKGNANPLEIVQIPKIFERLDLVLILLALVPLAVTPIIHTVYGTLDII